MPKVSLPPPTSIPKEVQKDMSLRFSGLLGKGLGKRKRRKGKGKGERGREKDKLKTQVSSFLRKGTIGKMARPQKGKGFFFI